MRAWHIALAGGLVGVALGIPSHWTDEAIGGLFAYFLVGALIGGLLGRWLEGQARKGG